MKTLYPLSYDKKWFPTRKHLREPAGTRHDEVRGGSPGHSPREGVLGESVWAYERGKGQGPLLVRSLPPGREFVVYVHPVVLNLCHNRSLGPMNP